MPKILFVAVFSDTSTNNGQSKGFKNLGCEVIEYNYRLRAKEVGNAERDSEIVSLCKKLKPDLTLFAKCNTVDVNVIKECSKHSTTALYYPDPLDGNYNNELIEKIKYCELVFVAKPNVLEDIIAKKYNDNSFLVEEGFDHTVYRPVNIEKTIDVSFIGGLKEHRQLFYDKVGFSVFTNAYAEEHCTIVSKSKINLNFVSNGGVSDRVFKVLASKGFLLTEDWVGRTLKDREHLVIFNGIEDLKNKIEYYLKNENEREVIAENGYKEVQKYSVETYAKQILTALKDYNEQ